MQTAASSQKKGPVPEDEVPLIEVTRAVVSAPGADLGPLVARPRPEGFSRTTLALVRNTLARGAVLNLARRGGWMSARHVVDGQVRSGRLWERQESLPLHFGPFTLELLIGLAYGQTGPKEPADDQQREMSFVARAQGSGRGDRVEQPGDDLVAYLAAGLLARRGELSKRASVVSRSPLAWLAYPYLLSETEEPPSVEVMRAMLERSASILEALQADLMRCVVRTERAKAPLSLETHIRGGEAQHKVLEAFFEATAHRFDLARYLFQAGRELAQTSPRSSHWLVLDEGASLGMRSRGGRAAAAYLRALERFYERGRQFQAVRFFEDDFEAAQVYLEAWAELGEERYARLRRIAAALEAAAYRPF